MPGDQRANLLAFLSKFPGFADQTNFDAKADDGLDRLVKRLTDNKHDFSTEIKPWFSGQIGVSVEADDPRRPAVLMVVSVRDPRTPRPLADLDRASRRHPRDGQRHRPDRDRRPRRSETEVAWGIDGSVVLAGTVDAVKAAITPRAEQRPRGRRWLQGGRGRARRRRPGHRLHRHQGLPQVLANVPRPQMLCPVGASTADRNPEPGAAAHLRSRPACPAGSPCAFEPSPTTSSSTRPCRRSHRSPGYPASRDKHARHQPAREHRRPVRGARRRRRWSSRPHPAREAARRADCRPGRRHAPSTSAGSTSAIGWIGDADVVVLQPATASAAVSSPRPPTPTASADLVTALKSPGQPGRCAGRDHAQHRDLRRPHDHDPCRHGVRRRPAPRAFDRLHPDRRARDRGDR